MEPLISDYYNDMPQMVGVIDGMNKELTDVQNELSAMKNKYEPLIVKDKWEDWIDFMEKVLPNKLRDIITPNIYNNKMYKARYRTLHIVGTIDTDILISECTQYIVIGGDKSHLFKILKEYFMDVSNNEEYSKRISREMCRHIRGSKNSYCKNTIYIMKKL